LFNTLLEGFCVIEVLFDTAGRPVDFRFLEVNPAFAAQTGLRNARGRLVSELIPNLEALWFETYGRIASTGEPARFVNEARGLNRWYDVSAYRLGGPGSRKVAILFNDITERRRLESEVLEVTDREKRRIGHDLHDGLGQQLTALEMKSFLLLEDLAVDDLAASRETLREQARQMSQSLRDCIKVTRSIAHGLAPVALKTDGLKGALEQLASVTRVPGKLECRLGCRTPVILEDSRTSMHLYRIAQEAVNNALKHARARRIHISLAHVPGELRLEIRDDGRGFPRNAKAAPGIGLEVMRHRAQVIGASLEIASKNGHGVSVVCTLPLKES
jgi:signal transduction histidine kinase